MKKNKRLHEKESEFRFWLEVITSGLALAAWIGLIVFLAIKAGPVEARIWAGITTFFLPIIFWLGVRFHNVLYEERKQGRKEGVDEILGAGLSVADVKDEISTRRTHRRAQARASQNGHQPMLPEPPRGTFSVTRPPEEGGMIDL